MRERLRDKKMKILKTAGKVIAAPVLFCVFLLARCFQFFLKVCGAVVTFVCILAAVVLTIGVVAQIALQMQGRGPGIAAIIISVLVAAVLAYVPGAGVGAVMVVLEGICSWIMKFYKTALESVHIVHKRQDTNGPIMTGTAIKSTTVSGILPLERAREGYTTLRVSTPRRS